MKLIKMPHLAPATLNITTRSGQIVYTPAAGYEPNWFQRWLLRLCFGFILYRRDK